MSDTETREPDRVSNMTYAELVQFYHTQLGRVEMTWFRIMYLHAAMVGVLVFFGQAMDFLVVQRAIVFAFYTVNLLIFFHALREGQIAMRNAHRDLVQFADTEGAVDQWFRTHDSAYRIYLRALALGMAWLLVLFLLFYSVIIG